MKYLFIFIYTIYIVVRMRKNMHMLQQNFYNNSSRYVKWIKNNKKKALFRNDWLFIPLLFICAFIDNYCIIFSIFYLMVLLYTIKQNKKEVTKIKE